MGSKCACFLLQCGKMLYGAGGQLYPSQNKHTGRKHILYFELFQHKVTVAPQRRGILCWCCPISDNNPQRLISASRYLTWLRMNEIHFHWQQSQSGWPLLSKQLGGDHCKTFPVHHHCVILNEEQEGKCFQTADFWLSVTWDEWYFGESEQTKHNQDKDHNLTTVAWGEEGIHALGVIDESTSWTWTKMPSWHIKQTCMLTLVKCIQSQSLSHVTFCKSTYIWSSWCPFR